MKRWKRVAVITAGYLFVPGWLLCLLLVATAWFERAGGNRYASRSAGAKLPKGTSRESVARV